MPTSMTATSTPSSEKCRNAATVRSSKRVRAMPLTDSTSARRWRSVMNSSSSIGSEFTAIRSLTACRSGLVNDPTRSPVAPRRALVRVVVVPLPFVPVM
jgi:hypothetical protein